MSLKKWLKNAVQSAIDPNRDYRVQEIERLISHGLNTQKDKFSINQLKLSGHDESEIDDARKRVFNNILSRIWDDRVVTRAERQQLEWIRKALQLDAGQVRNLQRDFVKSAFEHVLANAMIDGIIDPREEKHLSHITSQLGYTVREYTRLFFKQESESFLRGVFLAAVNDGDLSQVEWNNLLNSIRVLGLDPDEFSRVIQEQAVVFVEHVLADAKADERISKAEEARLNWLVENLGLSVTAGDYIRREIALLRSIEQVDNGNLPTLRVPQGLEISAGELVHLQTGCRFIQVRHLKSGTRVDNHFGELIVTDKRTIFASDTRSFRISHRSVIGHAGSAAHIDIQVHGRPNIELRLDESGPLVYPIFRTAIALVNQTKIAKENGKRTRHISRDVRQVIWQRYSGRCAECSAGDYLEYDHIIPHSKGGSNSEANIQLLCRRCNLKKSDAI